MTPRLTWHVWACLPVWLQFCAQPLRHNYFRYPAISLKTLPSRFEWSRATIVFFTMHEDPDYVDAAFSCGASGYVLSLGPALIFFQQ